MSDVTGFSMAKKARKTSPERFSRCVKAVADYDMDYAVSVYLYELSDRRAQAVA